MLQPFTQYAAWRAEFIKADIEMEEYLLRRHRPKKTLEEKKARKKAYNERYKKEHPGKVKEYRQKYRAKKKAASDATNIRNGQLNLSPTV